MHPSWVKFRRLDRTETVLWMEGMSHFQRKGEEPHWQGKRSRKGRCEVFRTIEHAKRFKVSVGIAGQQVINRRIGGQGHGRNRTKDNQILLERETRNASLAKVERKANPKMLEHLFGITRLKPQLRARQRRLHRKLKQAQQLARSTRLNARRWICVNRKS